MEKQLFVNTRIDQTRVIIFKLVKIIKTMNLLQQSLIYFVLIFSIRIIDGKTFLNCELAKALSKVMTTSNDRTYIPHWICLANAESQMNTSKVTDLPNRSRSYGIFQVKLK